jgi:hypothetical protein
MNRLVNLFCFILTAWTAAVSLGSDSAVAVSANKAAIEQIRDFYAEVEQTQTIQKNDTKRTAQYWRTPNSVRVVEQTGQGTTTDIKILSNSQYVATLRNGVLPGKNEKQFGVAIISANRRAIETDPYELGLFVLPLGLSTKPSKPIFTLNEAYRSGTVQASGWTEIDNRKLYRICIDCELGQRSYEVWIDPSVNWLIRKCSQTMRENGKITWNIEYAIEEFAELKPSVFVPVRSKSVHIFRGERVAETSNQFRNVRVNQSLPDQPASPIPADGTKAFDEPANSMYVLSRNYTRIGQSVPLSDKIVPVIQRADAIEDPLAPPSARQIWLPRVALVVSLVLVVLGLVFRAKRRARNRAA